MEITITAVGPDNVGLADPIVHFVTGQGANITEIQMYNHDVDALFAMLLRIELDAEKLELLRKAMVDIGKHTKLSIRVWSPELRQQRPRLAICTTYRQEPPLALLRAVRDGETGWPDEATACSGMPPQRAKSPLRRKRAPRRFADFTFPSIILASSCGTSDIFIIICEFQVCKKMYNSPLAIRCSSTKVSPFTISVFDKTG